MATDVLGFATRGTKAAPASILSSKGTQKDINAMQKNAGVLSDVVGQGADDSYTQFVKQQQQKQQQVKQAQLAQQQQAQAAQQQQKQANSLLGRVKSAVSNDIVNPVVNTAKAAGDTVNSEVQRVKGNTQGATRSAQAASNAYNQSAAGSLLAPVAALRDQTVKQFKYLSGPTPTQAQRDQLIANQQKAQIAVGEGNPSLKTSNPSGGSLLDRAKRDVVSAYQHVNPFSGLHNANDAISQAQQQYGLTPGFIRTLHNANTSMTGKSLMNGTAQAVTTLPGKDSGNVNRTLISNQKQSASGVKNASAADNLVHEGLHQVWAANPKLHGQFATDYNQNTNPQLQSYLRQSLNISKSVNLSDFNKLPSVLQDEIHSATIHYYTNPNGNAPPQNGLTKYYSQFLNPTQAQATNAKQQLADAHIPKGVDPSQLQPMADKNGNQWLEDQNGKKYPITSASPVQPVKSQAAAQLLKKYGGDHSVQGANKVDQMLAEGKSLPEIEQFLKKDQQATSAQERKGAGIAAALATDVLGGSSVKEGVTAAKTAGKDLVQQTAKTANIAAANNVASTEAANPNASKADIGKALIQGEALGSLLHIAGHFGGQPLSAAIERSNAAKNFVTNQQTQSLLQKAAAQTAEKNQVAAAKIDNKIALVEAKKPDGKFTNVDKVKVAQLKDEKAQLTGDTGAATTPAPAVTGEAKPLGTEPVQAPAAVKSESSVGSVAPAEIKPDTASIKEQITNIKNDEKSYDPNGNITPEAGKQITTLNKQLNAAGERVPKAEKPVTVTPIESTPASLATPEIKTSKLADRAETRGIKKGLTEAFHDKPEYAKVNMQKQAEATAGLLKTDPDRLVRIAMGHEKPPEGLLPESAWVAAVNHATKTSDGELLRKLGTESHLVSEATGMGQRIRALGELDPRNPGKAIKELSDARAKAAEKRTGKPIAKATSDEIKAIRAAKPKVTPQTVDSFIESLKC